MLTSVKHDLHVHLAFNVSSTVASDLGVIPLKGNSSVCEGSSVVITRETRWRISVVAVR